MIACGGRGGNTLALSEALLAGGRKNTEWNGGAPTEPVKRSAKRARVERGTGTRSLAETTRLLLDCGLARIDQPVAVGVQLREDFGPAEKLARA
jgi:hypothetical protein